MVNKTWKLKSSEAEINLTVEQNMGLALFKATFSCFTNWVTFREINFYMSMGFTISPLITMLTIKLWLVV